MASNRWKPFKPIADDPGDAVPKTPKKHAGGGKIDTMVAFIAYSCGGLALLTMIGAYDRQMHPRGRHYGDPELYLLAAVLILVGIPAACLVRLKWPALAVNLLAASMIAATLIAELVFHVPFPR